MTVKSKCRTIRLLVSGLFLLSSLLKIWSVKAFALEVELYLDAYMGGMLRGKSLLLAVGVCALEFALGFLGVFGRKVGWWGVSALGVLSFFVWLTGVNLFFPSAIGIIESCGCFGELIHFNPIASFVKSVVLWGCILYFCVTIFTERKRKQKDGEQRDKVLYKE